MALIEFRADFKQLVAVLERIAQALDRAYPIRVKLKLNQIGREALTHISDEKLWERQNHPPEEAPKRTA